MKRSFLTLFLFVATTLIANGELIQLTLNGTAQGSYLYSDPISLEDGDTAQLISLTNANGEYIVISTTIDGHEYALTPVDTYRNVGSVILAGPATIRLRTSRNDGSAEHVALFLVSRGGGLTGSVMTPQEDPNATFEVFMEASTDLENWVRVIPGDYDASGGAKFFRVRMIKK